MIQRIQSVYLLLAALTMSAGIYSLPLMEIGGEPYALKESPTYLIMAGLSAGISLATIFGYKNRRTQVVMNRLNIILTFVLIGLIMAGFLGEPEHVEANIGMGMIMPLMNVVFLVLANRGIQKDELLVRSADRLR